MPDREFRQILRTAFLRFYVNPMRILRILQKHPRPLTALWVGFKSFTSKFMTISFRRMPH